MKGEKNLLNRTTYHDIYRYDGLLVFKGKNSVQDINNGLAEIQKTARKGAGNQHLKFIAEIWTNYTNLPPSTKEDKVQIVMNDEFPFLDMKMS